MEIRLLSRCPAYTGHHALSPSRGLGSTRSLDWTSEYLLVLFRLVTFHCQHNALKWFGERIDYVGSRPRESDSFMPFFVHYDGVLPKYRFQMSGWCCLALAIHCSRWPSSTITFTLGIECLYFVGKVHRHDRRHPTLPSLLGFLTHSPALHQDSKNIHAVAYLCFLLFHVIVVPIVSFLSWFMHCFSIDYAITEAASSDLRTFQLIAKIHKTSEKKRIVERKTIIAVFYCCIS